MIFTHCTIPDSFLFYMHDFEYLFLRASSSGIIPSDKRNKLREWPRKAYKMRCLGQTSFNWRLAQPKMTYIVKAFCLLVLFVALEIGTEAQQTKPPLVSSIKLCYGERCFKGQQCCGPKAKCQECCRNQHCPRGQICRYILFFRIEGLRCKKKLRVVNIAGT